MRTTGACDVQPGMSGSQPPQDKLRLDIHNTFLHVTDGDVHLAAFCDYPLAVAIPILRVSTWRNAMGAMNRCVAFIDGAHSKKGHDSPETNPFRGTW